MNGISLNFFKKLVLNFDLHILFPKKKSNSHLKKHKKNYTKCLRFRHLMENCAIKKPTLNLIQDKKQKQHDNQQNQDTQIFNKQKSKCKFLTIVQSTR